MSTWNFTDAARGFVADSALADKLHRATNLSLEKRDKVVAGLPQWEDLRQRARQIKLHTLTHLDRYVEQFVAAAEQAGAVVHWAGDAKAAQELIVDIARRSGVQRVLKGKTMAGEEIEINRCLKDAGIEPVETDFGEFICQLAGRMPSHVTAPIIEWSVEDIQKLLAERGIARGVASPGSAESDRERVAANLVAAARSYLREKFLSAQMCITGANFAVAESGVLVLIENEANIRLSTTLTPIQIAIVGIDKLIPRLDDLGVFLTLLPVSATGQRQTCYVSLIHRPLERLEIILLDNGRTNLLADPEQFDLLSCIRCGACQNVCPVYRHVSGQAYGGIYGGPIGAVLQPHLGGTDRYGELPFASSLCGACSDVCPVAIPLHERLLEWRNRLTADGRQPWMKRAAFRAWGWAMRHPLLYRRLRPPAEWLNEWGANTPVGKAWSKTRELPGVAPESFADWWRRTRGPADD